MFKKIWNNGSSRVYFLSFIIGLPLLTIAGIGFYNYENNKYFNGYFIEQTGETWYKFSDGLKDNLPLDISKIFPLYDNAKISNISLSKAKDSEIFEGRIVIHTADNIEKLKEFYKKEFKNFLEENSESFSFEKNNQKIKIILDNNQYADYPLKEQNRFEVKFEK